jgi:hypothetical protein
MVACESAFGRLQLIPHARGCCRYALRRLLRWLFGKRHSASFHGLAARPLRNIAEFRAEFDLFGKMPIT